MTFATALSTNKTFRMIMLTVVKDYIVWLDKFCAFGTPFAETFKVALMMKN